MLKAWFSSLKGKKNSYCLVLVLLVSLITSLLDFIQEFNFISIICILLCGILIFLSSVAIQRCLDKETYKTSLTFKEILTTDLLRALFILAFILLACVLYGLAVLVLQLTILPYLGFNASILVLEILAILICMAVLPLMVIVFFAPISKAQKTQDTNIAKPSRSTKLKQSKLSNIKGFFRRIAYRFILLIRVETKDIKSALPVYLPALAVAVSALVLGCGVHLILGFIPYRVVFLIVSFVVSTIFGFIWIVCIYNLCRDVATSAIRGRSFDWKKSLHLDNPRLNRFVRSISRVSNKTTACILSFV